MKLGLSIISLSLTLSLTSCAVLKETPKPDLIKVGKNSFKKFDGTYSNVSVDSAIDSNNIGRALWTNIAQYKYTSQNFPNWKNQIVKIKMTSRHKMSFELYQDGNPVKTKIIHGRLKGGYFYRRQFSLIIPFFPIWFGYWTDKSRFGIGQNKIYVDGADNYWMFAFLAGGGNKSQATTSYERKSE